MKRAGTPQDMRRMPRQWQRDAEKARRAGLKDIRARFKKRRPVGNPQQCRHLLKLWQEHRLREVITYADRKGINCIASLLTVLGKNLA